jgi:hypothetical protein
MFWNKKNKNKSHIKDWVLDELDDLYEIVERL